jgi:hypothetical protein
MALTFDMIVRDGDLTAPHVGEPVPSPETLAA